VPWWTLVSSRNDARSATGEMSPLTRLISSIISVLHIYQNSRNEVVLNYFA
jgi:hypothetical protein